MRHRRAGRKLDRNIHQRKALFKNLISALVLHGKIRTTEAKGKAIRVLVDRLISRAKQGTLAARRLIAAFLPDKKVVNKLVDEVAPKLKQRSGGFTSFKRIARRRGDKAVIVEVELLDQPIITGEKIIKKAEKKTKKVVKKIAKKPVVRKAMPVRQTLVKKPQVRGGSRTQAAVQKRGLAK